MYVLLAVFGSNHSCNKSGENTCGEDDRFGSPRSSYAVAIFSLFFFAVLAALLKLEFVGAPGEPAFLIFSPEPSAIRFLLACMFAYSPGLAMLTFPFA